MENPEEVLQALDEFQKMRPSEIPRELEEYLCWVAKTGDPVYQWSLIKPLFREKLTRVMTDFYESCPTLELAPCPNVEQFNYDIMKCNLLELLESFANAPFTVQRICELLTSPRKEYNRVDKFMRAIEKNILVVSTREPGPAARRSENGDGMVNGSIDEDAPSSQPSHEVEMESWVKNFTADATVGVTAEETGVPLLDSVITASKVAKIVASGEETLPIIGEKQEETTPKTDVNNSNVTTISSDLSNTCNVNITVQAQDSMISDASIDNLSNNGAESGTMVSEVPEAVMNEDTSSQPSLDSEVGDEAETPSCRKLQTTFRTKDFGKSDVESSKLYADEAKEDSEKNRGVSETENDSSSVASEDTTEKSIIETKISFDCRESVIPIVENLLEKRPRVEITDAETGESPHSTDDGTSPAKKSCIVADIIERNNDSFIAAVDIKRAQEGTKKIDDNTIERLSSEKMGNDEEECKEHPLSNVTDDSLPESERSGEINENKPIIEEPSFEESIDDESTCKNSSRIVEQADNGVTIEEAMDEDTRINKSIVPDPIPIIEEPKEAEQTSRDSTSGTTTIEELPNEESTVSQLVPPIEIVTEPTTIVQGAMSSEEIVNVEPIVIQQDITDVRNSPTSTEEKIEPAAESMEIDGEESMPVFQQDEPMEQEPGDLVKS